VFDDYNEKEKWEREEPWQVMKMEKAYVMNVENHVSREEKSYEKTTTPR
jgi:hypothetical protein